MSFLSVVYRVWKFTSKLVSRLLLPPCCFSDEVYGSLYLTIWSGWLVVINSSRSHMLIICTMHVLARYAQYGELSLEKAFSRSYMLAAYTFHALQRHSQRYAQYCELSLEKAFSRSYMLTAYTFHALERHSQRNAQYCGLSLEKAFSRSHIHFIRCNGTTSAMPSTANFHWRKHSVDRIC